VYLCRSSDIGDDEARGFQPNANGSDTVLVVRVDGLVHAYQNRCPHEGTPLEYRKDNFLSGDRKQIVCFAHGALFQRDTGLCVAGPCAGLSLERIACVEESGFIKLHEKKKGGRPPVEF
jgi:nitrite reductase/ring-hydroxylating ferredoxin subunit